MKTILRICYRDLWSLMVVPTGAIVAALFTFSCGIVFVAQILEPNGIASMQPMFEFAAWLLLLLCPAITMRLIAEERNVGTWELVLASPISSFEIAKGKFLSAFFFLVLVLLSTLPLVIVLELYANVDYGAVASGYLGLLLLGSAVMATGLVVSAVTTSQTVAYLVTAFIWLTVSLAMKVLPAYVPTQFADFFFAIDPDLRTAAFSIGLIDSANIVFFMSITIAMGWISIVVIQKTRHDKTTLWKIVVCCVLLILTVFSINDLALHNSFRVRIDATGTRAYTLSNQTTQLLDGLEDPWKIVVLLDDARVGKPILRQIDEVLRRYQEGSPQLSIVRIDLTKVNSIEEYEQLLRELIELYGDELATAEVAIQSGISQFTELMTFASSMSVWAETLVELPSTTEEQETLRTLSSVFALLGAEGHVILDEVHKAMRIDESQPLPQISFARDILVAATGQWSRELAEVAWWLTNDRSASIADICVSEAPLFDAMAAKLAVSDDSLRRLGELELGLLATQLTVGEGAIILSPGRATMIPASMLFPTRIGGTNTISVDQRFRGEQIISSAMRSLQSNDLPTVVFVHAEKNSLLGHRPNNIDVRAASGLLETSRFQVREWIPSEGPRPSIDSSSVVWIVIPPTSRAGLELSPREQTLLESVRGLIAADEPILLNMQPSLLPRYGQQDPWATLAESLGVTADTKHILVERVAVGPNQLEVQRGQMVKDTNSEHLIARAVQGRQIYIPLPIPIEGGEPLLVVHPSSDRWLDEQWEREISNVSSRPPLQEEIALASAVTHHGGTRAIVVGSGGWLFSWATDRAISLGGDSVALVNPGNSEFLLASVEWLSGLDDWIAAGPIGQQSSRVVGLSKSMYLVWAGILVIGIPGMLLVSIAIFSIRRNAQ